MQLRNRSDETTLQIALEVRSPLHEVERAVVENASALGTKPKSGA